MTQVVGKDEDVQEWLTVLLAGLLHLARELGAPQTNRMLVAMDRASDDYRRENGEAEYRSWFGA